MKTIAAIQMSAMSRFAPQFMVQMAQEYVGAGHVAVPAPFAGNREETDELLMLLRSLALSEAKAAPTPCADRVEALRFRSEKR
jgi:hypothetical protein